MTEPRPNLAEYVVVDTSKRRADRMWLTLRARLDSEARPMQRSRLWRSGLVVLSLGMAFGAGLFWAERPPASGWAELETGTGTTAVQLREGSRLNLGPGTALQVRQGVEQRVELSLERGRVECDVVAQPARVFSVAAAGYDVVVTGTRFSVDLTEKRQLAVDVEAGRVEIRRTAFAAPEAVLTAGGHWSVQLEGALAPAEPPEQSVAGPTAPQQAAPAAQSPGDAGVAVPAVSGAAPPASPRSSQPVTQRDVAEKGARLLLDQGNAARRRGDLQAAARAYEALLAEYADDTRAGLAAFELGRLRMDHFRDLPGALTALQLAAKSLTDKGLREDALARLVRAFELLEDSERCQAAREAYLEDYPMGTHVVAIAQACAGK